MATHITERATQHRLLAEPDLRLSPECLKLANDIVRKLRSQDADLIRRLLVQGTIRSETLVMKLDRDVLARALQTPGHDLSPDLFEISAPVRLRRRGVEAKLVVGAPKPAPDPVILRTLADAHRWIAALKAGTPLSEIARAAGHHDAFIRTRGQLAFLSPKIQVAILEGTFPTELTLRRIMRRPIPLDWQDQARLFDV